MSHQPTPTLRLPPSPSKTKIFFSQNYRQPITVCPVCHQHPSRINGLPFLICPNQHQFYECPTCLDTRITEIRENVLYCGLLHPYHLCTVHQVPVVGTAYMRPGKCSCQPIKSIIRQEKLKNWDSPFL